MCKQCKLEIATDGLQSRFHRYALPFNQTLVWIRSVFDTMLQKEFDVSNTRMKWNETDRNVSIEIWNVFNGLMCDFYWIQNQMDF